jgi:SAM-dependent methyltransferase
LSDTRSAGPSGADAPGSLPLATFAAAVFTSAGLLFLVQPMVGKLLLPLFGGAAAVWTTCLVFFQAALLLGYLLAHLAARRLGPRAQALAHLALLAAALALLPIRVPAEVAPAGEANPLGRLLLALTLRVGLPFVALAATGTLLQSWWSRSGGRGSQDPYFLYAASNLGSLLALLAYPFLVEPRIGLGAQRRAWSAGFVLLVALAGAAAWVFVSKAAAAPPVAAGAAPPLSAWRRVRWVACAFVPSSLMMGVTLFLTADVAPVPLLWVVPLALYLLAFVVAFARAPRLAARLSWLALPTALLLVYFTYSEIVYPTLAAIALNLAVLFLLSLAYLSKLAADRPPAAQLTEFYLLLSIGGVLAGVFNGLLAPVLFRTSAEYGLVLVAATAFLPVVLGRPGVGPVWPRGERRVADVSLAVAAGLLAAWMVGAWPLRGFDLTRPAEWVGFPRWRLTTVLTYAAPVVACAALYAFRRRLAFALAIAAFAAVCAVDNARTNPSLHRERSFYSVLAVRDDDRSGCRTLWSGTTPHGRQALSDERRRVPQQFYHPATPIGQVFAAHEGHGAPRRIGIVGLGTGALAAYGGPGESLTFYEIDPAVAAIARNRDFFGYLSDARADVRIVLGDARLRLAEEPPARFDLIVIDAFSSDAIPAHLLTREALRVFLDKLAPHGVLAYHVSNRHLVLAPVVGRLAREAGLVAREQLWAGEDDCGSFSTLWVVVARGPGDLGELLLDPAWKEIPLPTEARAWTDDYSSLLAAWR